MQLALIQAITPIPTGRIDLRCCDVVEMMDDVAPVANVVLADPPWSYDMTENRGNAGDQYGCISLPEIVAHLDRAHEAAAADAYLAVWCTWPLLGAFLAHTSRAEWSWGDLLTGGAWVKDGSCGVGYHWRGNSEPLLIYRKGRPWRDPTRALSNAAVERRQRHSAKPIGWLADIIRSWCPPGGTVLELYAGLGSGARATLIAGEGRSYVGAELDPERHAQAQALLAQVRR